MCCGLFFEDGQIIISFVMSLRQGGKKNPESCMFFKHHLTVTALTDPLRLTDSLSVCVWGGAGWMGAQGSIEVIRQRRREMHAEEARKDTA